MGGSQRHPSFASFDETQGRSVKAASVGKVVQGPALGTAKPSKDGSNRSI
jgi:hypothetical protein